MSEKARVTVVRDGFTRMFEMNGAGLVELVTVRGELRTEDAAALQLRVSEFLEHALPQVHGGRRSVSDETLALPAATIEQEGETRPLNMHERARQRTDILVEYVTEHPGATKARIVDDLGWTVSETTNGLKRAVEHSRLRPRHHKWYVAKSTRAATPGARRGGPGRSVTGPGWEETYAWLRAHPGCTREDMMEQLGFEKRQDVNNRLLVLRNKGLVTTPEDGRIWPVLGPPDAEHPSDS